jgi:hypothetical protein
MADFFKGLSGGFNTGLQLGQQLRQRRMEDELAQAYAKPETSQGYTAEDAQRMEEYAKSGMYDIVPQYAPAAEGQAQGVFTGYQAVPKAGVDAPGTAPLSPISFNQQQVQDYGGRRVAGQFNPEQLRGIQMREAAGVLGRYGDVRGAAALEAQAAEQEYQAKRRQLEMQQLEGSIAGQAQQRELTGLQLDEGKRTAAKVKRMDDFNIWRSQNPDADFKTINAKVQELGMGVEEQFKVASNLTGIGEQEFKASQQRIQKLVKNQGLDGLLKAHKESDDLDPGSHFEVTRGKGGVVSLNRVDTATGKIIQPNVFSGTEAETTAYLNKAAVEPATIIDYTMNLEKNKAAINASKASAAKDNSLAARYARDEPEKGLTKKITEMEAVLGRKLTPAEKETALGLINKPRDEKPQKVEEAGVQYKVDGKLVQTDGMGGFMSVKGILPADRPAALKAAGVSDNNLSRVLWSNDGEAVMFNNEEFDIRDKRDVAKLNKALTEYDTMNRKIAEENKLRSNPQSPSGFQGARTTGIGPASTYGAATNAPSIYGR